MLRSACRAHGRVQQPEVKVPLASERYSGPSTHPRLLRGPWWTSLDSCSGGAVLTADRKWWNRAQCPARYPAPPTGARLVRCRVRFLSHEPGKNVHVEERGPRASPEPPRMLAPRSNPNGRLDGLHLPLRDHRRWWYAGTTRPSGRRHPVPSIEFADAKCQLKRHEEPNSGEIARQMLAPCNVGERATETTAGVWPVDLGRSGRRWQPGFRIIRRLVPVTARTLRSAARQGSGSASAQ